MKKLILALLSLTTVACSIHQEVTPFAYKDQEKKVCVVNNPDVKEGFLETYRTSLEQKDFEVAVLEPGAGFNSCQLTSTYTANWLWDLALYIAYAEIKVYGNATPVAEAVYDSRRGGANMDKFIDAETKIQELANLLFPMPELAAK